MRASCCSGIDGNLGATVDPCRLTASGADDPALSGELTVAVWPPPTAADSGQDDCLLSAAILWRSARWVGPVQLVEFGFGDLAVLAEGRFKPRMKPDQAFF